MSSNHNHEHDHCHECEHEHHHEDEELTIMDKILTCIGVILTIIAYMLMNKLQVISVVLYIIAYMAIGYKIILKAFKHLFSKDMFDENLIMTVATLGAMAIGEYTEAIAVLILYMIGEMLQDKAVDSSKEKISKVLDLKISEVMLKEGKAKRTEDVKVGEEIIIKTGDRVPLDCSLVSESAQLDMSALNGESGYVNIKKGNEVLSGSINVGNAIDLRVIREEKDSTISKIVELVENASKNKSKTEKYISKFCKYYTPIVIFLAVLVLICLPLIFKVSINDAVYRALNFLVISCPCALVISIPLGFFVGMGAASKKGILAKGTIYLDELTNIDEIYMDKTGTLTDGKFSVSSINSTSEYTEDEILEYIALAEYKSNHVIARSIIEKYQKHIDEARITEHEEISGYGIKAIIDSKQVICGNNKIIEQNNIKYEKNTGIGTIVHLAVDGEYKGFVILSDTIKSGSKKLVECLHKNGISQVTMLTGDRKNAAEQIGKEIEVDKVYYELLPQDKVCIIEEAKERGKNVAFIGDGINDSPVIASANVGIAMGKGSDIAVETADVVFMTDEPDKIIEAINISKKTKMIVNENIIIIILAKILFLTLSVFGMTNMWIAVFADVGVAIIAIFNSLRIFKYKEKIKK